MIVSGDKVYLGGVIGVDDTGKVVPGGVAKEATQALRTAIKRLAFVNLDLSDGELCRWSPPDSTVVSVTIYVSNYTVDFGAMNEASS
jgi:enamine deaminase RidA (YjgF/YER057c/UK114 family)